MVIFTAVKAIVNSYFGPGVTVVLGRVHPTLGAV